MRPQSEHVRHRRDKEHPGVRCVEVAAHRFFSDADQSLQVKGVIHDHKNRALVILFLLEEMSQRGE